jgi:hypothetical protein
MDQRILPARPRVRCSTFVSRIGTLRRVQPMAWDCTVLRNLQARVLGGSVGPRSITALDVHAFTRSRLIFVIRNYGPTSIMKLESQLALYPRVNIVSATNRVLILQG